MEAVTLERYADVPLSFEGEVIATASSEEDGNDRWEELTIWRTASDRCPWVIRRVGRSDRPDETDMLHVWRCKNELDVRKYLKKQDLRDKKRWYLTSLAIQALEEAAAADPRLQTVLTERIT